MQSRPSQVKAIGNLLGSVSLIKLLFLLMAFLYVDVELIVQPYFASNCHPCFFWLDIKKFICTAFGVSGNGGRAPLTLHLGSGYRYLVSFTPRLLDSQGKSSFYPLQGTGCVVEPFWTLQRREKFISSAGKRTRIFSVNEHVAQSLYRLRRLFLVLTRLNEA